MGDDMLAQEWLDGHRVECAHDRMLEKHLRLPETYNRHSTVASLNQLAERIVFTDDVPTMLYDMHENKQLTYEGVIKSAKLPYDLFWMEYNTTVGMGTMTDVRSCRYGALIQRIGGGKVRWIIVTGMNIMDRGWVSTICYIVDFDEWPPLIMMEGKAGIQFRVRYAFNQHAMEALGDRDRELTKELGNTINELMFGVFLITQPRVYSEERVKYKQSHARSRAAKGLPPLLEYRKLKVHVHKTYKRYTGKGQRPAIAAMNTVDTESEAAIRHRRYHKVIGHFRHYLNQDEPHTVWIEPHYRGDPALGITFTERDVSK